MFMPITDRPRYSATLTASIITNLRKKNPYYTVLTCNLLSPSIHRHILRGTKWPSLGIHCTSGDCYSLRTARQITLRYRKSPTVN